MFLPGAPESCTACSRVGVDVRVTVIASVNDDEGPKIRVWDFDQFSARRVGDFAL
jgi:hypothetical protein